MTNDYKIELVFKHMNRLMRSGACMTTLNPWLAKLDILQAQQK